MLKMFVFIDVWFVKQDIKKWLNTNICSFFMENLKIKQMTDFFFTFRSGNSNSRFSVIFLTMIWIFTAGRVTRSNQNILVKEIGLYFSIDFKTNPKLFISSTLIFWDTQYGLWLYESVKSLFKSWVIFLPMIWIFTKGQGDEIKFRRGS